MANVYRGWEENARGMEGSVRETGDTRKNVREAKKNHEALDHITEKKMNTGVRPLNFGFRSKEAIKKSFCRVMTTGTKLQGVNQC